MPFQSIMVSSTLFAIGAYFIYSKLNVNSEREQTMQEKILNQHDDINKIDSLIMSSLEWVSNNKESMLGGIFLVLGVLFTGYTIWSQNHEDEDEISGNPMKYNLS